MVGDVRERVSNDRQPTEFVQTQAAGEPLVERQDDDRVEPFVGEFENDVGRFVDPLRVPQYGNRERRVLSEILDP